MKSGWSSYCRKCANKKSLDWKRNNQERQLANTKAWREANPDKVKQYREKARVREQERAAALDWKRRNPEKARIKDQRRRAKKLDAVCGTPINKEGIDCLLSDQKGLCAYCKCELDGNYHIDHFVPLAQDGTHSLENILLSCPTCNLRKGAKSPLSFMNTKEPSKIKTTEACEQARVVIWSHKKTVRDLMPELQWLHHSPNGEKRDVKTGNKLKALGVKRGFPDLILPVASRAVAGACGLAIEMKSETGSLAPEQKGWLQLLDSQGWITHVCRSAQEARNAICSYLNVSPDSAPPLP